MVLIVNSLASLLVKVLAAVLGFGYSQQNFFNYNLPQYVDFCGPYVAQFKLFLADLMFFIPKTVLVTCASILVAITVVRIIAAIVNLVTW